MLLTADEVDQLDALEETCRTEWNALLGRLCEADLQAMSRTWDRVEEWMLQGAEAELAPLDKGAVRHLLQLQAVAMIQLRVIRLFDQLQHRPPTIPLRAATTPPPRAA